MPLTAKASRKAEGSGSEQPLSVRMKIGGMTCAMCAQAIKGTLEGLDGVGRADVDLASETATISIDRSKVKATDMVKAVNGLGYKAEPETVVIRVGGMTCAMCVSAVGSTLASLPGVVSAQVNLSSETARIEHLPTMTSLDQIKDAIVDLGYRYDGQVRDGVDDAERSHRMDQRMRLIRLTLGFALAIPMMIVMLLDPMLPVDMEYILLGITTPALAFIAYPIFAQAYRSLRHGYLTMEVMYAMGISVAFIASTLGTFDLVLDRSFMFFDTTLMLASFLILGKYLEARAKSRTNTAIKKLMGLAPKEATVLRGQMQQLRGRVHDQR
jgi:P-type Cu+ transporter